MNLLMLKNFCKCHQSNILLSFLLEIQLNKNGAIQQLMWTYQNQKNGKACRSKQSHGATFHLRIVNVEFSKQIAEVDKGEGNQDMLLSDVVHDCRQGLRVVVARRNQCKETCSGQPDDAIEL